ncbi:MAG TPA: hypothetical protein VGR28_04965 [Candidatus Thermoplasmatota archaeon]|jgi:hypothetical protein|nr:hypothetical protein [Candidatus Thermoplasmatota archaeon]
MRPLHVVAGLGLVVVSLLLVPASASHQGASCKSFSFGLVTPLTPAVCETQVLCPAGAGACVFHLYADTEGGGLVTVDATVDGERVATCGPMLGTCGGIGTFTIPAGTTAAVRCATGAVTASLMAEVDCNPSPL